MLIANYHTHTKLCNHAEGMPSDYIEEAIRLGFKEIGMSDHNPIPVSFLGKDLYMDNWCHRNMSYDVYKNIYLKEMDLVKEKYGKQIKIYSGLECEYLLEYYDYYKSLRDDLDYLNLGLHFFKSNGKIINTYHEVDYKNVYDYAINAIMGMETGLFKTLVHPDLFMFEYKNKDGKREFDEYALKASRAIIESAIKNDVYLEINANGIANSEKFGINDTWLYPDINFWKLVKEYKDAKIIIGADAHKLSALSCKAIDDVSNMAKKLGLNVKNTIEFA